MNILEIFRHFPSTAPSYASGFDSVKERFENIKAAYRWHDDLVRNGVASWNCDDPYKIADWISILSPIEYAAWQDIRCEGLPLWPQLPVGRFFVDFGNPVAKVALECDGKQWHQDKEKDQKRQDVLVAMGWTVYRAPGSSCFTDYSTPDNWIDMSESERRIWQERVEKGSLKPILRQIKARLVKAGQMNWVTQ